MDMDLPKSSRPSLWQRAPWWRRAVISAVVVSAAGGFLAYEQLVPHLASQPTAAAPAMPAANLNALSSARAEPTTPSQLPTAAPAPVSNEEEQALASCQPHLASGPPTMPQLDVSGMPQPNTGHIKIHMWVDGAGVVVRDVITSSNMGSMAEFQDQLNYAKSLTYSLPNTKECRSREVEVIGDVFEMRQNERWTTLMRLYPRYSFDNAGVLRIRD